MLGIFGGIFTPKKVRQNNTSEEDIPQKPIFYNMLSPLPPLSHPTVLSATKKDIIWQFSRLQDRKIAITAVLPPQPPKNVPNYHAKEHFFFKVILLLLATSTQLL